MSRALESEPTSPETVRAWTTRRDAVVPALRSPERKNGKGLVRRAWDKIPTPVKVIGGAVLLGLGLQWFFKGMADQHAIIGKRTNEVAKGISGATKATDPVSGLTGRGAVVSDPGTGAADQNPGIAGSSDRPSRLVPGDKR